MCMAWDCDYSYNNIVAIVTFTMVTITIATFHLIAMVTFTTVTITMVTITIATSQWQ